MPQSLSNILVHLVFSTKERARLIEDSWRNELHGYIGGIIRRCGGELIAANSVEDHIHLFFPLPRTISIADLVKEIKTGATKWIHERGINKVYFHWQAGYGVFSVSPSHKKAVMQYIADQQAHHQKISFQDEYRRLLKKYEIVFEEKYLWD